MGYYEQLHKASVWLASIQNKEDLGWGLSEGQGSSIVNTSEAIIVLKRSNSHHEVISNGLQYIYSTLEKHITKEPRTRYTFFALNALLENPDIADHKFIERWSSWLLKARNSDGGWGNVANDEKSSLFPTSMSLLVLHKLNYKVNELNTGFNWLLTHKTDRGWPFNDGEPISLVATGMAVLALRCIKSATDPVFNSPKELMLENEHWGTEIENLPGTVWAHCTYMWIFPALMSLKVEPYSKTIAEGVRDVNIYASSEGWKEPNGALTIRGQYWGTVAFHAILNAFDPAIHTYRIDSSLAHISMKEPDFVNIRIRSSWGIVIPSKLYRLIAYILFCISLITFSGIYRYVEHIPRNADFIVAVAFFGFSYFMVRKRKNLFPKYFLWVVIGIVSLFAFVHEILGWSVLEIFEHFK